MAEYDDDRAARLAAVRFAVEFAKAGCKLLGLESPILADDLEWLLEELARAEAERDAARAPPAARWEADHQRAALERHGLAEEFPWGCDAIDAVAEALLAARRQRDAARAEAGRLKGAAAELGAACDRRGRELSAAKEAVAVASACLAGVGCGCACDDAAPAGWGLCADCLREACARLRELEACLKGR